MAPRNDNEVRLKLLERGLEDLRVSFSKNAEQMEKVIEKLRLESNRSQDDEERRISDMMERIRSDLITKADDSARRIKELEVSLTTVLTDMTVLKSERTDFKALWTFVRNSIIGVLVGAALAYFLKPPT